MYLYANCWVYCPSKYNLTYYTSTTPSCKWLFKHVNRLVYIALFLCQIRMFIFYHILTSSLFPSTYIAKDPQSGKQYRIQNHTAAPLPGYDAAVEACRKIRGVLPKPRNAEEDNFLETLTETHGVYLPLGMKDNETEGTWLSSHHGFQVYYFNWIKWNHFYRPEPNGGTEQNCAFRLRQDWFSNPDLALMFEGEPTMRWVDGSCSKPVEILVCEISGEYIALRYIVKRV